MNRGVLVWGYLASFILFLGSIFISMDLLAGRVLYLTGFMAFNIGYLIPLFYVIFKENQENKIGIVLVFSILGFLTFLTGVSFFVVNWGGGIVLIYVGGGILIAAILSLIILFRRFYETHIDSWFPVLIFGVFIVISLLTGMVHRHVMRAFTVDNKESVELLYSSQNKNIQLYKQLMMLDTLSDVRLKDIESKVLLLRMETGQTIKYIEELKLMLIKEVEGDAYKLFEGKTFDNLVPVQSNVEINSVSNFMLRKRDGKAYELKGKIGHLKDTIFSIIPEDLTWLREYATINLNTKTHELDNRRFNKTWEYQQFYDFPLITVLSGLSNIQWKISIIEGEVLNYFYQEGLKLGNGDLPVIKRTIEDNKLN
jgi:hypothetical protein